MSSRQPLPALPYLLRPCSERLLVSYLRRSNIEAAKHAWAILALLIKRLRRAWPGVRIVFRGDSGFCRWRLLRWCERPGGLHRGHCAQCLLRASRPWLKSLR